MCGMLDRTSENASSRQFGQQGTSAQPLERSSSTSSFSPGVTEKRTFGVEPPLQIHFGGKRRERPRHEKGVSVARVE